MKDSAPILQIPISKKQLVLQVLLVFVVPILLIKTGSIPITWRVPFLVGMSVVLGIVMYVQGWKLSTIGIHPHIKKSHIVAYTVFTLVAVIATSQFGERIGYEELAKWWKHQHFLYIFFVVSLFQEFLYRGYLIPVLKKLSSSSTTVIVVNALLFMLLHIIFPNLYIGLPIALIGGVAFAIMYMMYPDLVLIILSHAVINFCAVLYGFFVIPGIT